MHLLTSQGGLSKAADLSRGASVWPAGGIQALRCGLPPPSGRDKLVDPSHVRPPLKLPRDGVSAW